jgi:hypothetical protein
MIHVSTVAARAPTASLRDGASATLAPTAPTSNAARTRGTGVERVRARDCPATGPVRNGSAGCHPTPCCSPWSRADSHSTVRILRKDLRAWTADHARTRPPRPGGSPLATALLASHSNRLPLPLIVHAAPAASRAAAPSLRDAFGTLDPPDTTRRAACTRERGRSRHPGRADWPVPRGDVEGALTAARRMPDRPPVCRMRAKVRDGAILEGVSRHVGRLIRPGELLPLKGSQCGFESHRGHPARTTKTGR